MGFTGATDEELLGACRRGDETAWDALVGRFERLVFSVPRRAGLDQDASSDVFQTVFVRLVAALGSIEHPDRLRAWLVTTARRETWRYIARRKSMPVAFASDPDFEDEIDRVPDAAPLADEEIERLEMQHAIRAAVELLDGRCRELITLLFYTTDPPPYAEIAERLGIPVGSVGPTRARCLQKLLERLDDSSR